MGQLKGTQDEGTVGSYCLRLLQTDQCSTSFTMGYNLFEKTFEQMIHEEKHITDQYKGWRKTFNNNTLLGRRNVVLLTLGSYIGIFALFKVKKALTAAPAE